MKLKTFLEIEEHQEETEPKSEEQEDTIQGCND
jgi:hypothetical protein